MTESKVKLTKARLTELVAELRAERDAALHGNNELIAALHEAEAREQGWREAAIAVNHSLNSFKTILGRLALSQEGRGE